MSTLRVQLDDLATQQQLSQLRARLGNLRPLMADIGEHQLRSTDTNFRNETAPDGTPWAPLAQATLRRKERRGKILKVLQEEGLMRSTLSYNPTADSVEIGSVQPYSVYAFYPRYGPGKNEARPFLGLSAGDERAIGEIVQEWLEG